MIRSGEQKVTVFSSGGICLLGIGSCLVGNSLLFVTGLMIRFTGYQNESGSIYTSGFARQILLAGLLYPIIEEMIFRGVIFKQISLRAGFYLGCLLSSLLFAVYHGNLVQGIYAFGSGCLLAIIYEIWDDLKGAVILHCSMNITALIFQRLFNEINPAVCIAIGSVAILFSMICFKKHKTSL